MSVDRGGRIRFRDNNGIRAAGPTKSVYRFNPERTLRGFSTRDGRDAALDKSEVAADRECGDADLCRVKDALRRARLQTVRLRIRKSIVNNTNIVFKRYWKYNVFHKIPVTFHTIIITIIVLRSVEQNLLRKINIFIDPHSL